MQLTEFLDSLKAGNPVSFDQSIFTITQNYDYTPTAFSNGIGDQRIVNQAGNNEGSCKLFAFAKLHALDKEQTLALFGDYYRDVLNNPEGIDHQNIRNFMRFGWKGIEFDGIPLNPKQI